MTPRERREWLARQGVHIARHPLHRLDRRTVRPYEAVPMRWGLYTIACVVGLAALPYWLVRYAEQAVRRRLPRERDRRWAGRAPQDDDTGLFV